MIGSRLKDLRLKRGISQIELGKIVNVAKSSIASYELELRSPTIEVLKKLSRFFEVSIDYLVGNDIYEFKNKRIHLTNDEINLIFKLRKEKNRS